MGLFDEFLGWVQCPHCQSLNRVSIQFKWLHESRNEYTIGDYIDGNAPFSIFDKEEQRCESCHMDFETYVIGKDGFLFGFCNNLQLDSWKNIVPFSSENQKMITLCFQDGLIEEIGVDAAFDLAKQTFLQNPSKLYHYINSSSSDVDLKDLVCRIPSTVKNPNNRPHVGQRVYYDPRSNLNDPWYESDVLWIITQINFSEEKSLYYCTIEHNGEVIQLVPEPSLLNRVQRDEAVNRLQAIRNDILRYNTLRNSSNEQKQSDYDFLKFRVHFHYASMVEKMKEDGEIPLDFSDEF